MKKSKSSVNWHVSSLTCHLVCAVTDLLGEWSECPEEPSKFNVNDTRPYRRDVLAAPRTQIGTTEFKLRDVDVYERQASIQKAMLMVREENGKTMSKNHIVRAGAE
ncbi:MAG: hypothetical protein EOO38_30250 [Cytophagaceae bacterium]|nr:MAG: hypothetical protein EOO38_30250 [Cytophagaceae bacterium]